jgi:hypothetical protein
MSHECRADLRENMLAEVEVIRPRPVRLPAGESDQKISDPGDR